MTCIIIEIIGAIKIAVFIHVVMIVRGVPVMVMVLAGAFVCVASTRIGSAWMGIDNKRETKNDNQQYTNDSFHKATSF